MDLNFQNSQQSLLIKLNPSYIPLDEVTVSSVSMNYSGKELIKLAIKNIKKNYESEKTSLNFFYREKVKQNDTIILANESLGVIQYTKYPQKNYVRKSWRAYWDENFADNNQPRNPTCKKYIAFGTPQFFKYYNTLHDHCYVTNFRKSDPQLVEQIYPSVKGGPLALTSIDKVKYLADFLDPSLQDEYEFVRKEATYIDGTLCIAVGFKPVSYTHLTLPTKRIV